MKGVYRKTLSGFIPVDDVAKAEHAKCKLGQDVLGDMKRHRYMPNHRRYWKLCEIIMENTDRYETKAQVSNMLKIATGHRDEIQTRKGLCWIPHSMNMASMDAGEFDEFYNAAINLTCAKIIPNLDPGGLRSEIENLCGVGASS